MEGMQSAHARIAGELRTTMEEMQSAEARIAANRASRQFRALHERIMDENAAGGVETEARWNYLSARVRTCETELSALLDHTAAVQEQLNVTMAGVDLAGSGSRANRRVALEQMAAQLQLQFTTKKKELHVALREQMAALSNPTNVPGRWCDSPSVLAIPNTKIDHTFGPDGLCEEFDEEKWRAAMAKEREEEDRLGLSALNYLLKEGDGERVAAFLEKLPPADKTLAVGWQYEYPNGLDRRILDALSNGGLGGWPLPPIWHAIASNSKSCVLTLLANGADMLDTRAGASQEAVSAVTAGVACGKREAICGWLESIPEKSRLAPRHGKDYRTSPVNDPGYDEEDDPHPAWPATLVDIALFHKQDEMAKDLVRLGGWTGWTGELCQDTDQHHAKVNLDFCKRHIPKSTKQAEQEQLAAEARAKKAEQERVAAAGAMRKAEQERLAAEAAAKQVLEERRLSAAAMRKAELDVEAVVPFTRELAHMLHHAYFNKLSEPGATVSARGGSLVYKFDTNYFVQVPQFKFHICSITDDLKISTPMEHKGSLYITFHPRESVANLGQIQAFVQTALQVSLN